jgi:hypothetical protein
MSDYQISTTGTALHWRLNSSSLRVRQPIMSRRYLGLRQVAVTPLPKEARDLAGSAVRRRS